MGTSATTGEEFYSGDWTDIQDLLRTLKIGAGKIAQISQELVEFYQEMIDREIDGILNELYFTPIRMFNQVQPDGSTKTLFPGEIRYITRYWSAGALALTEFQGLDPNMTEQVTQYIDESRRRAYRLLRYNHRIQGQEIKSNISRTMPPALQPPFLPEQDF